MENITKEQADIIGEVANICTGTAATALSMIINRSTNITTPLVEVLDKEDTLESDNHILVKVPYTSGLDGTNLMVLDVQDALVIASLMMGGDGRNLSNLQLDDLTLSAIAEAMMVAFGTASSSATLPLTIACCEKRGISHKISSFVLPLGATLNMDGTALLQTVAVIFLAQAYGVALTPFLIIEIALLAIVSSSTCAGIPGAGLITIALILNGMGLSPEQLVAGFAFLFTIERITDMMRTLVNVTSDAVVVAAIADNENEINYDLLNNPAAYEDIA